jgi:hypothetical protein
MVTDGCSAKAPDHRTGCFAAFSSDDMPDSESCRRSEGWTT